MVTEGAALEANGAHRPHLRTLCGESVPVGVHRVQLDINQCDDCHRHLTKMIGDAFDLLG